MNLKDVRSIFPEAAYLLFLLIPIVLLLWSYWRYRVRMAGIYADRDLQPNVAFLPSKGVFIEKAMALCLAWVFAVLALMQPISYGYYPEQAAKGIQKKSSMQRKPHHLIFLLDASASMLVKDMRDGRARLDFAKEAAEGIVRKLDGESVALEAFTSDATPLSPLTPGYFFVLSQIKHMQVNEGNSAGTDLLKALQEVERSYFLDKAVVKTTLILLTDGEDTRLEFSQGLDKQNREREIAGFMANAKNKGVETIVIGTGTKQGGFVPGITYEGKKVVSRLNEELLQKISRSAGGRYVYANAFAAINLGEMIAKELNRQSISQQSVEKTSVFEPQDNLVHARYFQIPLFLAILLLAGALLLPENRARARASMLLPIS